MRVTHTAAPRKEGKHRRVMKTVVMWLACHGFLGTWQFIIKLVYTGCKVEIQSKQNRTHSKYSGIRITTIHPH